MSDTQLIQGGRQVQDVFGRRYRVGERDRDLLGHPRHWVAAAAWLAMLAVSTMQYGFGVLVPELAGSHGSRLSALWWALAVWVMCQSAVMMPLIRRWRLLRTAPRASTALGAVLCAAGLFSLAHSSSPVLLIVGYGVMGGFGAGLVYLSCIRVVAGWYPDRPARVATVSGAFCYGSIPFILI
ncbi:MAG: MFS transporter, partial [Sciscionella sp.]